MEDKSIKDNEIKKYAEKITNNKLRQLDEGYNILKEKHTQEKSKKLFAKAEKIIKPLKKKIDEFTKKANKQLLGAKIKILSERKYDYDSESDIMVFRPFQVNVDLDIQPEMFESFLRLEYDIENSKKLDDSKKSIIKAKDKIMEALLFKNREEQEKLVEELKKL